MKRKKPRPIWCVVDVPTGIVEGPPLPRFVKRACTCCLVVQYLPVLPKRRKKKRGPDDK